MDAGSWSCQSGHEEILATPAIDAAFEMERHKLQLLVASCFPSYMYGCA